MEHFKKFLPLLLCAALLCGCAAVPEPEDELPPASAGASSEEPAEEISALPEEFALPPQEYELEQATAEELFAAFMDMLNREEPESSIPEIAKKVDADKYTVRTQLVKIRAKLKEGASVTFEELFEATSVKLEKIVTFMALLEMIARQEILLKQSTPYGRITITAYNLKEDDADAEYMDE